MGVPATAVRASVLHPGLVVAVIAGQDRVAGQSSRMRDLADIELDTSVQDHPNSLRGSLRRAPAQECPG
jgi:hypothetical protein